MNWDDFRLTKRLNLSASNAEQVYSAISEIDAVKNSWSITANLLPQTNERLTHSVIVTSTGSSNRIEGNKLTDAEVENLYKNLNIKKLNTRDKQEVAGYINCLELIFQNYKDISINESTVLKLHHDMLTYSEKDSHHKGNYKIGSNRVEAKDSEGKVVGIIFDPTPAYLVKKETHELIEWYNWAITNKFRHPLLILANFIFEYLAIHPFQDGNGRTSRLLTNLMLLQHEYLFASLVSHEKIIETNKLDYYLALNKTQATWKTESENIFPWLSFFLNVVKEQSAQALKLIATDNVESLLSEKQLALWQWASTEKSEFSRKDAIEALSFHPRTTEESIKKLLELKCLERLGQGKATRYRVIK